MKKIVNINEISKEELYRLYIESLNKYDLLEAKFFDQQKELADKVKKT